VDRVLRVSTASEGSRHNGGRRTGWHFLQIPGPTNTPARILAAMSRPTIDHRGPEFLSLSRGILADIREIFQTAHPVIVFPSSGTGAWEAALVNIASPGDRVLMAETGHFSKLWSEVAMRLGLRPELVPGDWRSGADPEAIAAWLSEDRQHEIKAVCVVHNETSTGAFSRIGDIRRAIDATGHPALFIVDTISSLGSMEYRPDAWGVDITVAGSQKGLMLPPGLGFNAVGPKALAMARKATLPKSYFDWQAMLAAPETGQFPYTPATNLMFGLREAIDMLLEEGLDAVFARHERHATAVRNAVDAWGLELLCASIEERSNALTAVMMPATKSADALRAHILRRFDVSLGSGLSRLSDKVFRIGHLGDLNDIMLIGTVSAVEMGLKETGIAVRGSGVQAAMKSLSRETGTAGEPLAVS